mgnify:FL=1
MGAFHAYDIRGIYGVDFDAETAYKVAYFLPSLLNVGKVLVGRDVRVSSDEIHEAVLKGVTDAGADVYDLGLATTPLVYYGTAKHGFGASIQITASHNPKEYNGMKVSRENALPVGLDSGLGTIKKWIDEGRPTPISDKKGRVYQFDIKAEYISFLEGYKEDISNLDISMDISNGMAALFARPLFGNLPHYIFEDMDGTFPNHEANPLIGENREALVGAVKKNGSDIGVVYDGDADRVMFVDENGRFISPDLVIGLLGHYFMRNGGEALVLQDIRSSKAVGEYLATMGGSMATLRVGRAFAAPKLRELGGLWGGELAGHYYFRDFFYSDSGMLASILVLNVIAQFKKEGVKVSELVSRIEKYKNSGEINFKIEDKRGAMDAVRDHFVSKETPVASMDFDGYRVEFPQWWFNIRPSNTEPYLRFICEASSEDLLQQKISDARKIIEGRQ